MEFSTRVAIPVHTALQCWMKDISTSLAQDRFFSQSCVEWTTNGEAACDSATHVTSFSDT